jgi:hypothetical protein
MRLALLDEEFEASANALLSEGMPVVVLKGMDLGRRYYEERLQRPMTDVDLLVPTQELGRAVEILSRKGFKKIGPHPSGRIRVEMARNEESPAVELHHRLLSGDSEHWLRGIWRRADQVRIPGIRGTLRVLSPEDQIVYLIRHAAVQHLLESPIWLKDIQLVIENAKSLDWVSIASELRGSRSCAAGLLVLSMLKREGGVYVPDRAIWQLCKGLSRTRRRAIEAMATKAIWFDPSRKGYFDVLRRRFLLRDSWLEAIAYALWAFREHGGETLSVAIRGRKMDH